MSMCCSKAAIRVSCPVLVPAGHMSVSMTISLMCPSSSVTALLASDLKRTQLSMWQVSPFIKPMERPLLQDEDGVKSNVGKSFAISM